jgi:phenylacetate-CoA ligase
MEKKGYYIEKLKDALSNRVRFPVFDLSDEVLYKYYLIFTKTSFESIYGYTSSIVYFCRYLIAHNYCLKTICPSLKNVITTSELLTPEDRKIIEQASGVKVVNEYGASELGIIGFEDEHFNLRLSEELIYAEVNNASYNDESVVSGELLTTSLFNKGMPIIKYQIGDIATLTKNYIGKYRNILSLDGRVNDFAKLPSGKTAPGLTFYYISRSILESSGSLKEFIIRQTAIDTFEFDVVSDIEITTQQKQEILSKMDLYLEPNLKLIINNVSRIERPNSGKIKHFYNQLK